MSYSKSVLPSSSEYPSLTEARLWCSLQPLTATSPETEDTLRSRARIEQANALFRKIYKIDPNKYYELPDYKRVMELYQSVDMNSLALLASQLRTSDLKPPHDIGQNVNDCPIQATVEFVVAARSRQLLQAHADTVRTSRDEPKGKLLRYFPRENLACGAARYSSNGFFDDNNVPPWDTWVKYADNALVSWVPEILVPLAQDGIDANPEGCIGWIP